MFYNMAYSDNDNFKTNEVLEQTVFFFKMYFPSFTSTLLVIIVKIICNIL